MPFDGHGDTYIPLQQVPYFNNFLQNHQVTITNTHTKCTLRIHIIMCGQLVQGKDLVSQPFAEERFNAVRHPPTTYTE
jgi:hypothetical protein